jgi:hypothetical protein
VELTKGDAFSRSNLTWTPAARHSIGEELRRNCAYSIVALSAQPLSSSSQCTPSRQPAASHSLTQFALSQLPGCSSAHFLKCTDFDQLVSRGAHAGT